MGLYGKPGIDIAVYLGQILKNLERKVLIADLTEEKSLYYLFSVSQKFPVNYGKVDYIGEEFPVYIKENTHYNIVILCMKDLVKQPVGLTVDVCYYITDTQYANLKAMQCSVRNGHRVSGIIVRDVTEGSINVPYLLTYVLKDEYLIGLYEKKLVYTIPDDLTDREYRVSMQYGNFGEFRNLSPDFLEVLKIMAMEITGDKPGNVKLALKYAKEGKNIEKHNILEQHFRKKRDK